MYDLICVHKSSPVNVKFKDLDFKELMSVLIILENVQAVRKQGYVFVVKKSKEVKHNEYH